MFCKGWDGGSLPWALPSALGQALLGGLGTLNFERAGRVKVLERFLGAVTAIRVGLPSAASQRGVGECCRAWLRGPPPSAV